MPKYQPPRSDDDRLSFLTKAADTGAQDRTAGRPSITQQTLDAIVAFLLIFRPLADAITGALAGRVKEVREREEARAELDNYVRDFWEVLKRRAHRLHHPAEVLEYFGLHLDGNVPVISTFDELLRAADKIVQGEDEAVAAGYPKMSNPSTAEIAPILAAARAQAADVPPADRIYDQAQSAIAAQRPAADELIDDVRADLLSSLRRMDAPSQRRILRSYGATFVALPGEPADPLEAATGGTAGSGSPGSAPGGSGSSGSGSPS